MHKIEAFVKGNDVDWIKSKQFAIYLSEEQKRIKEMDATFIEIMIETEREYADCDKEAEEVEKVCAGKNYLTNVECSL